MCLRYLQGEMLRIKMDSSFVNFSPTENKYRLKRVFGRRYFVTGLDLILCTKRSAYSKAEKKQKTKQTSTLQIITD